MKERKNIGMKEKTILFVDDEESILKSINRIFIDTSYVIYTAKSGNEALNILKEVDVELVISDMRMPNMDGYTLLSEVKRLCPNTIRIILSGYSDEKLVFKALQQNIAKLYIMKPWDNKELINIINQIFEIEELLLEKNFFSIINNINELPTMNQRYQRMISIIEDDGDIDMLTRSIESDFVVSSKLLHIVNSAYYKIKTGSIKQAVVYLGLQNVRSLIQTTAIIDTFTDAISIKTKKLYDLIWKQAFFCNRIVNMIYNDFLQRKLPEVAFTAGLLHNIGILLLLKIYGESYSDMIIKAQNDSTAILEVEKVGFGIVHSEAGGYLLKWWDLPLPIIEAALFHHTPFDNRVINKEIVSVVYLAQKYACEILGISVFTEVESGIFESLNIDRDMFEKAVKKMEVE